MAKQRTKKPSVKRTPVQRIRPCLTFSSGAEEAVNFYVSLFKGARIIDEMRVEEAGGPIPKGALLHATFEMGGQEYTAFDGGPSFSFSQGFSLVATCKTQKELDHIWKELCDGGTPGPCGWLTDKFGVAWQVVPEALGQMMSDPDGGDSAAVMEALLKMGKLDIKTLEKAYKRPQA